MADAAKEKRIRDAVEQGIRDADFSLLSDPKWRDVYDEETLYEIQKRLRQYYDENPEEYERIWDKYYESPTWATIVQLAGIAMRRWHRHWGGR